MINLMYVVLMAMLALNVSTDVLKGFDLVGESLSRTTTTQSAKTSLFWLILNNNIVLIPPR